MIMDTTQKAPTQPRKVSDDNAARIDEFKTWLLDYDAEFLSKSFLNIYFEYTQLLAENPIKICTDTARDLYNIQVFIEILSKAASKQA